jgi:hypothetical protein
VRVGLVDVAAEAAHAAREEARAGAEVVGARGAGLVDVLVAVPRLLPVEEQRVPRQLRARRAR